MMLKTVSWRLLKMSKTVNTVYRMEKLFTDRGYLRMHIIEYSSEPFSAKGRIVTLGRLEA